MNALPGKPGLFVLGQFCAIHGGRFATLKWVGSVDETFQSRLSQFEFGGCQEHLLTILTIVNSQEDSASFDCLTFSNHNLRHATAESAAELDLWRGGFDTPNRKDRVGFRRLAFRNRRRV